MSQITHDNHFVPQLYPKQWSDNRSRIWGYRILVPHQNVEKWTLRAIRGVAFQRDLYTSISKGREVDEFEKWLEAEFETPVQNSIARVVQEKPLKQSDWKQLIRFLAAQDVRTPANYLESMERWRNTLPDLLEPTLNESIKEVEKSKENKEPIKALASNSLFKKSLSEEPHVR
jgi:hypothetical protein